MSEKTQSYEGMFLVDSGQVSFEVASEPIRGILSRRSAEVLAIKPWDDRKLAYEIRGRKRGLYVLCHFKVNPLTVVEIEHDCRLDERILRALFLRKDRLTPEQINAETPATSAGHKPPEAVTAGAAPAGTAPAGEAPAGAPPVATPAGEAPRTAPPAEAVAKSESPAPAPAETQEQAAPESQEQQK